MYVEWNFVLNIFEIYFRMPKPTFNIIPIISNNFYDCYEYA